MVQINSLLRAVSRATLGNLLGRAANVLIPLAVISIYGADQHTDQFFFVLAVAFFFYATTANALTETTVPLLLSGRFSLIRGVMLKTGVGCSCIVLVCALGWRLFFGRLSLTYAAALGLMSGAGLLNGLATGTLYAREVYALPGLLWLVRLLPLTVFLLSHVPSDQLGWLALGLGVADWLRGLLLIRGPAVAPPSQAQPGAMGLRAASRSYLTVLAASVIMGLNPIVDRIIAQHMGAGAVSILETGERFYGMVGSLATMGLMTVLLTHLSQQGPPAEFDLNWRPLLKMIAGWGGFWVLVGIGAGVWVLDLWLAKATPLSPSQSASVKSVYWYYLMGLPVFMLGLAYVKRLQARTRFHMLVFTSVLAVALNIPASLILARIMGVAGIALATTLIYAINSLVLINADRHYRSSGINRPNSSRY